MNNCYLCGRTFNLTDVIKHDEHIIQQAIGGTLTDDGILCLSCGNSLGKLVDDPFSKMFDSFSTRLDIRKDRNAKKQGSATGTLVSKVDQFGNDLSGVKVFWKNFKITPIQPMHRFVCENAKVVVYANKKHLANYIKVVNKEIKVKFINNPPEIILCDDIDGVVEYSLRFDNEACKKGLAKIGLGFASKYGINRAKLTSVLDTEKKVIKDDIKIMQFYPLSIFDEVIEAEKSKIRHFPAHTLILFTTATEPQALVCYVELFSTFQWYVVLSENYIGDPVYSHHHQRLSKESDYVFSQGRRHHKERNVILSSLGITEERISAAYEKQKNDNPKSTEEVECAIIQEEYIKQKYTVIFKDEIKVAVDYAIRKLSEAENKSMDLIQDVLKNMKLYYELNDESSDVFNISSYRRCYYQSGMFHDYLCSVIEKYQAVDGFEMFKEYAHRKVHMLNKYIETKATLEKI